MKGCFYAIGGLFVLFLAGNFIFWFKNGPGNRYDVSRLKHDIAVNVPVGSTKTQVSSWLKTHGFTIYPYCFDASHKNKNGDFLNYGNPKYKHPLHDLLGRKDYTRSEIVCSYDVIVSFAFDKNNKIIRSGVEELSTCL